MKPTSWCLLATICGIVPGCAEDTGPGSNPVQVIDLGVLPESRSQVDITVRNGTGARWSEVGAEWGCEAPVTSPRLVAQDLGDGESVRVPVQFLDILHPGRRCHTLTVGDGSRNEDVLVCWRRIMKPHSDPAVPAAELGREGVFHGEFDLLLDADGPSGLTLDERVEFVGSTEALSATVESGRATTECLSTELAVIRVPVRYAGFLDPALSPAGGSVELLFSVDGNAVPLRAVVSPAHSAAPQQYALLDGNAAARTPVRIRTALDAVPSRVQPDGFGVARMEAGGGVSFEWSGHGTVGVLTMMSRDHEWDVDVIVVGGESL